VRIVAIATNGYYQFGIDANEVSRMVEKSNSVPKWYIVFETHEVGRSTPVGYFSNFSSFSIRAGSKLRDNRSDEALQVAPKVKT